MIFNHQRSFTSLLCFFCAIFTSALFAISHAGTIKDASDDVIPHTGQVPNAPSANDNRAVLLQVVVNARYVSGNFFAVGQSYTGDLSQSGVRLLGCLRSDYQAHTSLLW